MASFIGLCVVPILIALASSFPTLCTSQQDSFTCSRAAFYETPDCLGTPSGACGFGEFGRTLNGGDVAAVAKLYRGGAGCGACYQVRCTHPGSCDQNGVIVVATDHGESDHTDFILTSNAFSKLALPNMAQELMPYGAVDVEYKRVPCQYPGYNLMFKVTEDSKYPDYISILPVYQAGMKDIVVVHLRQDECKEWIEMRRAYGGVWDVANPPKGPLNLHLQLCGDDRQLQWIELKSVIPAYWKTGDIYESTVQTN